MTPQAVQRAFFAVLLLLVTVGFLWLIRGFVQPIFWAVAFAIVVYPMHARLDARLAPRRSLAAAASVVLVILIVIIPVIGLVAAVASEAATLVQGLNERSLADLFQQIRQSLPGPVSSLIDRLLQPLLGDDPGSESGFAELGSRIANAAVGVGSFLATRAFAIGQDTVRIFVYFFLMLYLLFFFLRDGPQMIDGLVRALPLGDARERHLLGRFAQVSRATIKGTLVVGAAQGAIGGLAFWMLGLAAPVLWGVVMGFLSIIPAVGPAVVWIPAAIYLFATGQILASVALVAIGVLVIGLVDNLLRPILVGRDTRMPDYLILLSTLGGLTAFGLAGIVIGPIIAAFFLSCWQMAHEEFGEDAVADGGTEASEGSGSVAEGPTS